MAANKESETDSSSAGEVVQHILRDENGRVKGQGRATSDGEAEYTSRSKDGSLEQGIRGGTPENETLSLSACRVLVKVLNEADANWSEPVEPDEERGVDCRSEDGESVLNIQVVQAVVDSNLWQELGEEGEVYTPSVSPSELANQLKEAIRKKDKVPPPDRPDITLALNALRTPAFTIEDVVEDFRSRHGRWAADLGFSAIWVVGRAPAFVWKLDAPSD